MATVNEIVQQIADEINKPYDNTIKKRIRSLLMLGKDKYIKQQINKYGINESYMGHARIDLEVVDVSEFCDAPQGCKILRSINKVPRPTLYRASEPFINVSSDNGVIVAFKTTKTNNKHIKFTRFLHSVPAYDYRNGYLEIYNNLKFRHLLLDFIPTDFKYVHNSEDCNNAQNCYSDDYEFLLDGDLIMALKIDIYNELGLSRHIETNDIPVTTPPVDPNVKP